MDNLTNKTYTNYNYTSRYTSVPYYYDKDADRYISGIGLPMKTTASYISHKVQPNDTLESLSLDYYNNPTYWWVIAYFNNIQDPFIQLKKKYATLKIPSISAVAFGEAR